MIKVGSLYSLPLLSQLHAPCLAQFAVKIYDEIGRLQTDEDVTVESSQSSSLIHMSVVDSGPGVRRSSVVFIEHVTYVNLSYNTPTPFSIIS